MTQRAFRIYRYDPEGEAAPAMQEIAVELDGSEISTQSSPCP